MIIATTIKNVTGIYEYEKFIIISNYDRRTFRKIENILILSVERRKYYKHYTNKRSGNKKDLHS